MDVLTKNKVVPKLRFSNFTDVWVKVDIGDILKIGSGRDYKHLNEGNIPVYGSGGLMKKVDQFLHDGESVCIGRKGTIDKPIYLNEKFWTVDTLFFTHSFQGVSVKFIFEIFNNINWYKYNEASGVPSLSKSTIEKIPTIIPGFAEQQKIAEFLSSVDKKIQLLEKKKEQLELYKKGVMQKIFSREIRFKDDNGNSYPDWEEWRLGDIANFRRGSFPQPYGLKKWYDDQNGFPFVQVFDVDENMRLKSKTKRKITEIAKAKSVFVKKGSLVLTIQGSIGRIARTQYDTCVDRTLLIFQSFNSDVVIDYFKYVIFLLFEIEKRKAPGGTIKTITKEALSAFKLSLPIEMEQKKIADFLSAIDNKIDTTSTQINKTKEFKKGLLQQMFV